MVVDGNGDVGEEIYGVGYIDGIDSIAMRDRRSVGRDASLTMSAHITDTDIRRAVRQARQTAERHAPEYDGQPLALDHVELQSATIRLETEDYTAFHLHTKEN